MRESPHFDLWIEFDRDDTAHIAEPRAFQVHRSVLLNPRLTITPADELPLAPCSSLATIEPMPDALIRQSLSEQVLVFLRSGIREGRWRGELPSEMTLCREMQVSRVTLRAALVQLAKEKMIILGGRGRHHRISRRRSAAAQKTGTVVRFLSPYDWAQAGVPQFSICAGIASRIAQEGFRLELEIHPALYRRNPDRELKRLSALPDTAGWIVTFGTEAMQRWFARHDFPCIILGRTYPGVKLSHVYPDNAAIGRHAAGHFLRAGHRELAYFIAELTSLGDRICAQAFAEEAARGGARAQVVVHSGEPAGVQQQLSALLTAHPRPSAFFSTSPEHCIALLTGLQHAGRRVPEDAAILCGQEDPMLHYTQPTIAHYDMQPGKLGRKAAAMFLASVKEGGARVRSTGILAKFVPGASLNPRGKA